MMSVRECNVCDVNARVKGAGGIPVWVWVCGRVSAGAGVGANASHAGHMM
jgi:hypothetical protein